MASPFKLFRKNRKLWLASLTILAMGGFVVLPTVMQMMGQRGQAAARKDVVTTKRYGNLSRIEVAQLQSDRQIVRRFLNDVAREVSTKQPNRQMPVALMVAQGLPVEEPAVVETWLLTNHADELGIAIDKAAVNDFIQEVSEGAVTQQEMIQLLDNMGLAESQLFRLLGYELKAMRIQHLVRSGLAPITPGERWDYYQRLHRSMSIELAELPVERFVGTVGDPDETALQEFFDKYKDKEHVPESPEPGFMIPRRIAVEYFKVDYDHLFAEGELEKYYEEHKEEFKRPVAEPAPSTPAAEQPQTSADAAEQPAPKAAETIEPKTEPKTEPAPPEGEKKTEPAETKSEPAPPEGEKKAEPEAKGEAAAPTVPAEEKKDAAEPKAEEAPKPTDESRARGRSIFQLAAYRPGEDAQPEEKPAETKEPQPASDPQPDAAEKPAAAEEKPADEKKPEEKPAETSQAEPMPAEPKAEAPKTDSPGEKPEPAPAAPAAAAKPEDAGTPKAAETKPPVQSPYYTFEEVKSQIQGRLGADKIERIFRPLENLMTLHHDAHIRYIREQDDQGNSSTPEPARPDFAKLAAEAGIEAKKTELFSQREGEELQFDIANSTVIVGEQRTGFLVYAFESLTELRPARSQDYQGNYYLFWKTQQETERVPTLKEEGIRAMAVGAWKMIEARGAAQTEAERLAAAARAAQTASKDPVPLSTSLAGEKNITVRSTEPFTWLDPLSIQFYLWRYQRPQLGTVRLIAPATEQGQTPAEPETLRFVGTDFMAAVAGLDKGDVGVAWNEPKTVAYIVRMVDTAPNESDLRSEFLASDNRQQLEVVAGLDKADSFRQWIKSLEAQVGLKWHQ